MLFSPATIHRCFEGIFERDWWPELARVACPTLVVRGSAGALPQTMAERMAATLQRGLLATVPDAGHCLHWDNPAGWHAAVAPFLAQHGAQG